MDLKKLLPKILRNDFWEEFVDSISEELDNTKTEIIKKLNYWYIDNLTDKDELLDIAKTLGYMPDLSLNDSIDKLKREIYSIIYRIKNKTNYESYYFIFKDIPYLGNVYNLFYDNIRFLRSVDMSTILTALNTHTMTEPFISVEPDFHYWAFIRATLSFGLDKSILETLDADPVLLLDQTIIRLSSSHLAIEYAIDRIITEENIEYLMTPTYLDYLQNAVNQTRKASVIPHIGAQVSFLMDSSGYYDINDTEDTGYTIPDIKVKCAITPFYLAESFSQIVVGTGLKSLYSEDYPDINSKLLAYYSFDEEDAYSTDIYDDISKSNVGLIIGNYTRETGIIGQAINFDGLNTKVEIPSIIKEDALIFDRGNCESTTPPMIEGETVPTTTEEGTWSRSNTKKYEGTYSWLLTSSASSWTEQTSPFGEENTAWNVAHNQSDLWVAVGNSGKLATSPDGINWELKTSSFGSSHIKGIAYNGSNLWVAVGWSGKLATSPDGINWTQRTSSFSTTYITNIAHNQSNLWVAVGGSGKLAISSNGTDWTQQISSFGSTAISDIAYNGSNLWVIVGGSGKLATSPDGVNWTQQTSSFGSSHINAVAYNGSNLWVATGNAGKLATSSNGIDWIQRTSSFTAIEISGIAHNQSDLWVAVGMNGKLATSFDGINWTQGNSTVGDNLLGIAYNGSNLWTTTGDSDIVTFLVNPPSKAYFTDSTDNDDMHGLTASKAYDLNGFIYSDNPTPSNVTIVFSEYYNFQWNDTVIYTLTASDTWVNFSNYIVLNESTTGIKIFVNMSTPGFVFNTYIDNMAIEYREWKTISLWINGVDGLQTGVEPRIVSQVDYIDLYYKNNTLKFSIGDSTTPLATLSTPFTLDGNDHFIIFEIDGNLGRLYIDNILKDSADITGIKDIVNNEDLYIGSKNNVYFFKGLIDEIRIYDRILSASEKLYMYTEKIGSLRKVANKFYKNTLSDEEIYSNTIWDIVHSCVEANMIKEEKIKEGDGVTEIFNGTLNYYPIVKNSLEIIYYSDTVEYTITDNGKGILSGSAATGTINYTTGYYYIVFYKDIDIDNELIFSGSTSSISDYSLDNIAILPGSFQLSYWSGETNYIVTDDGAGNITGTGITSATINYITGKLDVTFSTPTDSGKNIICNYTYENNSTPDDESNIIANYRLVNNINPTEVGIYDINENMVAYATFPPIKFSDYNNHIAFQFFIKKT